MQNNTIIIQQQFNQLQASDASSTHPPRHLEYPPRAPELQQRGGEVKRLAEGRVGEERGRDGAALPRRPLPLLLLLLLLLLLPPRVRPPEARPDQGPLLRRAGVQGGGEARQQGAHQGFGGEQMPGKNLMGQNGNIKYCKKRQLCSNKLLHLFKEMLRDFPHLKSSFLPNPPCAQRLIHFAVGSTAAISPTG